jgi:glycosyltransferase involved in cell wall biosynthesis
VNEPKNLVLSIVVPLYNEAAGLAAFHEELVKTLKDLVEGSCELIYCDDGSTDDTPDLVRQWSKANAHIKLVRLSRNFGKESTLSAGIAEASGQAILMLDGDGQHPIALIPKFFEAWRSGAKVVVGIRRDNKNEGWFKRFGSRVFYFVFNKFTNQELIPSSTDFRLIDRSVQEVFLTMQESGRITRGLIDWLGFKRELIYFSANAREHGSAAYGRKKLIKLAADSFASLTPTPLYIFGYLGVFITIGSFLLGLVVLIEQIILNDPLHWKFTGTAMLGILILFLVGIVLMSQGILSLYISHIHNQSKQRPLYVIDYEASAGIDKHSHNV